jgi:hypothetical protein
MQYTLKTRFGMSEESFGRTASQPNLGLGQGSVASPPAFMALSSLSQCLPTYGSRRSYLFVVFTSVVYFGSGNVC